MKYKLLFFFIFISFHCFSQTIAELETKITDAKARISSLYDGIDRSFVYIADLETSILTYQAEIERIKSLPPSPKVHIQVKQLLPDPAASFVAHQGYATIFELTYLIGPNPRLVRIAAWGGLSVADENIRDNIHSYYRGFQRNNIPILDEYIPQYIDLLSVSSIWEYQPNLPSDITMIPYPHFKGKPYILASVRFDSTGKPESIRWTVEPDWNLDRFILTSNRVKILANDMANAPAWFTSYIDQSIIK